MSNVNTDQRLLQAQVQPLVGITTSAQVVQFSSKLALYGQTGNAFVELPGQLKAVNKKVKVRVYGNYVGATVGSQTVTLALRFTNSAAATATISSAAAQAAATAGTYPFYLETEFLLDNFSQPGEFQGSWNNTLITRTALSALPAVVTSSTGPGGTPNYVTESGQFFSLTALAFAADPTAILNITEWSLEIL